MYLTNVTLSLFNKVFMLCCSEQTKNLFSRLYLRSLVGVLSHRLFSVGQKVMFHQRMLVHLGPYDPNNLCDSVVG